MGATYCFWLKSRGILRIYERWGNSWFSWLTLALRGMVSYQSLERGGSRYIRYDH